MADEEERLRSELYYLVLRFLERGPCVEAANALREELERHQLLPERYDHIRSSNARSILNQVRVDYPHITTDHLFQSLRQGSLALQQLNPVPVRAPASFLGAGGFSITRPLSRKKPCTILDQGPLNVQKLSVVQQSNHVNKAPLLHSARFTSVYPSSIVTSLISREVAGYKPISHLIPPMTYRNYITYSRVLGHLAAVYCVTFDKTGRYVITAADDHLIKIWSATDGRLMASLRGHQGEMTDLTVSPNNSMLASGSNDKMVRVWCLRTTAQITVLQGHTNHITQVKFCPIMHKESAEEVDGKPVEMKSFLVSTSNDGTVCFWKYNSTLNKFDSQPIRFDEKRKNSTQIVCGDFSAGGTFLATGASDAYLVVYHVSAPNGPTKVLQIEQHTNSVDSIVFSHFSMRFLSGSHDGTAYIWNFEKQNWKSTKLELTERLPDCPDIPPDDLTRKLRVLMVVWTSDDRYVATALSDNSIKVWNAKSAKLCHVLYGHQQEIYLVEAHPLDGRIILSAGHDGLVNLWDVVTGVNIQRHYLHINDQGAVGVFDCKFSPDGMMFACTDSHGYLTLFGLSQNDINYDNLPKEMFFHTDYRPLTRDQNQYVVDEQTQSAPHLLPPPFLVDIDGNPYPPEKQRLVPGREHCTEGQLIPYIADNFAPGEALLAESDEQREQRRVNAIDARIQEIIAANDNQARGGPNEPDRNVANRRDGDVEGVRHSANFISSDRNRLPMWYRRPLVAPFKEHHLELMRRKQRVKTEEEEEYYEVERKKRPDVQDIISMKVATQQQRFTRHKKRLLQQRQGVRARLSVRIGTGLADPFDEDMFEDANDEDFTGDEQSSSSSDDDDSDESDWNSPTTSNTRKRRRNSSGSEQEQEHEAPGPSRHRRTNEESLNPFQNGHFEEIQMQDKFRPPEWLTHCQPKKSPYFPQIGDEVVYFRQGHQKYLDKVREESVYSLNSQAKPYRLRGCDNDEIFAKIVSIHYIVKPPRLVILRLQVIDPQAEERETNIYFTVRYHDMADVVDFIILKKMYDLSISRDWRPGDQFRSVIDDKWWFGTINSIRDSDSYFQSFLVDWDNGDDEYLSPWDLEPIDQSMNQEDRLDGIPVTDEERQTFSMVDENEWPTEHRQRHREQLLLGLVRIMSLGHAEDFNAPVDLRRHPVYGITVPYMMDLNTIHERIESNFYRRIDAIKFDVDFLQSNAELFNEPGSEIVKKARIVTEVCRRFISFVVDSERDLDEIDTIHMQIYNEVVNDPEFIARNGRPAEDPVHPPIAATRRSVRRRVIHSASESENEARTSRPPEREEVRLRSWQENCRDLLDFLWPLEDSGPFRYPVDTSVYPTYSQVVSTPMDLSMVRESLLAHAYDSPVEFQKDMRRIIANSKAFNTNKKAKIYSMTVRFSTLFEEKMRKIMSDWKSTTRFLQNYRRGVVSSRRRPLPMSPLRHERPSSRATSSRHRGSSDLSQPSTSRAGSSRAPSRRSSQKSRRRASRKRVLTSPDKYSLRERNKRRKVYRDESDESGDEKARQSRATSYRLRNRRSSEDDLELDQEEEEVMDQPGPSKVVESVPDDDATEEDTEDEEEEDAESDEEEEEQDEEEEEEADDDGEVNQVDSDATQMDDEEEDDKENDTSERRPRRAKRVVNYDESNDESDAEGRRTKKSSTRNQRGSFAQINESSRDSMSSNRSSGGGHEDESRPLRRSQRRVRPRRRYSSESDNETSAILPNRSSARNTTRLDYARLENDDLYSAVKTRHRNSGSSSRNYNEDDDVYAPGPSHSNYSARRAVLSR